MRSRTQEPHQGIRSSGRGEGQLRLKAVVRGMVLCLRYGGRWWWWWRGKWENGLNARMGYSGGSGGGGDFLARILVHKGGRDD
eukprot:scaffold238876_cov28-Attheya_sp.AAC.1